MHIHRISKYAVTAVAAIGLMGLSQCPKDETRIGTAAGHISANPIDRVHMPGTLLVKGEDGYSVLWSNAWLIEASKPRPALTYTPEYEGQAEPTSVFLKACERSKAEGTLNAAVAKATAKLTGVSTEAVCLEEKLTSLVTANAADPQFLLAQHIADPASTSFRNGLKVGYEAANGARVFVVVELAYVASGKFIVDFDGNLDAEAQAKFSEKYKMDANAGWNFQDDNLTRTATIASPVSHFQKSFKLVDVTNQIKALE